MKKIILILLGIILVIVGICFLKFENSNKDTKAGETQEKSYSIVGEWKNDTLIKGYEFIYTFNADGTGKYNAAGTNINFKYTINGNNIAFMYTDKDTETWNTTFSVNEDILSIKDSNGEDTLYSYVYSIIQE